VRQRQVLKDNENAKILAWHSPGPLKSAFPREIWPTTTLFQCQMLLIDWHANVSSKTSQEGKKSRSCSESNWGRLDIKWIRTKSDLELALIKDSIPSGWVNSQPLHCFELVMALLRSGLENTNLHNQPPIVENLRQISTNIAHDQRTLARTPTCLAPGSPLTYTSSSNTNSRSLLVLTFSWCPSDLSSTLSTVFLGYSHQGDKGSCLDRLSPVYSIGRQLRLL